jgi:hypothetical protein
MEEQTDSLIWMHELNVEQTSNVKCNMSDVSVTWCKVGDDCNPDEIAGFHGQTVDSTNHNRCVMYPNHAHRAALSLQRMARGAGVRFNITSGSGCFQCDLGSATVLFTDGLKQLSVENKVQPLTKAGRTVEKKKKAEQAPAVAVPAPGDANSREQAPAVANPPEPAADTVIKIDDEHGQFDSAVDFLVQTSGGSENQGQKFQLSGRIWISRVPLISQMSTGITVDGVVCGGRAAGSNSIMPLFLDNENSDV